MEMEPSISDNIATYSALLSHFNCNCAYERTIWMYKDADFKKLNLLIADVIEINL